MNWFKRLYVGEKAKKRQDLLLRGLEEGKWQPEVYVILPPGNPQNVLDIVPSVIWQLLPAKERSFPVIGIAVTYWEALEVVRQIVEDLYRETGGFCLSDMIKDDDIEEQDNDEGV